MICKEIIAGIEEVIPKEYAESWDNVGLLAGRAGKEVTSVLLAVDATEKVIEEAVHLQADLLITHHPLIFSGCKQVSDQNFIGKRLVRLLQQDISYYAMHTNFDVAKMADLVADRCNIENRQVLEVTGEKEGNPIGIGCVGDFSQTMTLKECANNIKKLFGLETVKVFGDPEKKVKKVATCPGSGKSVLGEALAKNADVFITGDIDHHTGIDAVAQGLAIIDAGHFGLEKVFVPYMAEFLRKKYPEIEIHQAKEKNPFWTIS